MASAPEIDQTLFTRSESLRTDRDRFVAFSFSAGELLIELDRDYRVVFVVGALASLTGLETGQLVGLPFINLVSDRDRLLVSELLVASGRRRFDDIVVHLETPSGPSLPLALTGYRLSRLNDHCYLTLRRWRRPVASPGRDEQAREARSGLLRRDAFGAFAAASARAAMDRGDKVDFSMLELGDMDRLGDRLGESAQSELDAAIGACLRARSLSGDEACRLDKSRYSLVHPAETDIAGLQDRLGAVARTADPKNIGVTVNVTTIPVDCEQIDDEDIARALVHAMGRFCEDSPEGFSLESLSESLSDLADRSRVQIHAFREIVESGTFQVAFQPIVHLGSGRTHHFEALARIGRNGGAPAELITYAEQIGRIHQFDLVMCRKVLERLEELSGQGYRYMIAVNLSGGSLGKSTFVKALHELLSRHEPIRKQVVFEITESARIHDLDLVNRVAQSLRRAGHHVCLDDFGAGEAAFRYLRAFDVDMVKIDGQYLKDAQANARGRDFLKAMAVFLNSLDIAVVAEMVEDARSLQIIKECGIGFGQGHFLGVPSTDIACFEAPAPVHFRTPATCAV